MIWPLPLLLIWVVFAMTVSSDADDAQSCSAEALSSYNRPVHIAAIFIIFAVSSFGVLIPIASKFVPAFGIPPRVITFGKSFGVGVIIATALIHMLQPATEKLASPCLGDVWHEKYPSFAMLFAMCAILAMQLIEYLATTQLEHRFDGLHQTSTLRSHHDPTNNDPVITAHNTMIPETPQPPYQCTHDIIDTHPAVGHDDENIDSNNNNTNDENGRPRSQVTMVDESVANENYYVHGRRATIQDEKLEPTFTSCPAHDRTAWDSTTKGESMNDTKRWLSTVVLEFGILTHSVIIGITLGVTGQDEFSGLMIALCFHQFFEGFALGARIAEVNMINCKRALGMALFFAWTTPVGAAIGVGISSSYNGNSAAALLAQGIFDAVSSGILIYVGLVNLLASEMIFDDRFKKMRRSTKVGSFLSMYAGAAVMAVIGIWV
ncbi:Zinc/iron permease [Zychaea mexicana]|uniref:Zinc/iron permease n=1 Tax=Zychaea mexicana TaxID=64656 RepID=UPI0022FF2944|nr:Zinc/iron permease [Zychaea mexicana]KAI9490502.1 Zinc/iron permease [Zychaea mexicana]